MKSTLSEKITINCPVMMGKVFLENFFRERGEHRPELEKRHAVRLTLRASLEGPGGELSAKREVVATLVPVPAPLFAIEKIAVEWAPVQGPYPRFEGGLTIEADDTEFNSFLLTLKGTYEPPLGAVGKAFDAVLGRRIASATAMDLLTRIREEIEAAYATAEAQKKKQRDAQIAGTKRA